MNILHVESSLNWGGQEYRTLAEARWLNEHGHRAWIACNHDSELRRRAGDLGTDVHMRASFDPRASLALRRLCRRHAIDVIHVHSPKDAWLCYPLHLAGVPVVRSRQITNPVKRKWSRTFIYRRGCSRIIATADCIRRDLIARNGVPDEHIRVVGEGVDAAQFNPAVDGAVWRAEFGVSPDALLFGVVAMIRPEKGHAIFVEAARRVLRAHPHARFAIVGEGTGARECEHEVRAQIRAAFGDERAGPVFMTGFRSDAPRVMAALDVLVVPSTAEAQSLVVPQAFATRRAVIASEVGGLPELVRHEDTGLLVQPRSADSLSDAMCRLAEDASLRQSLAVRGHAYATRHLVFDRKMDYSLAIYREVAAAKGFSARGAHRAKAMSRGVGAFLRSYVFEREIFDGRPGLAASVNKAQAVFGRTMGAA